MVQTKTDWIEEEDGELICTYAAGVLKIGKGKKMTNVPTRAILYTRPPRVLSLSCHGIPLRVPWFFPSNLTSKMYSTRFWQKNYSLISVFSKTQRGFISSNKEYTLQREV
jgi:hypothetical protein